MTGAASAPRPARVTPARVRASRSAIRHVRADPIELRLHPPQLHVAGRPRPTCPTLPRGAAPRWPGSTAATTSATRRSSCARTSTRSWPRTASTCAGGRVLMLANPRVLGYVFNPLSVFWCHRPRRRARVHRRRGAQHLRRPARLPASSTDDAGRAETDKEFYVSPFYPVDGRYAMRCPSPASELRVTVTLHRRANGRSPRSDGRRRRARPQPVLLACALRHPPARPARSLLGSAGTASRLWLPAGCPVVPRPPHQPPGGRE